ncbi:CBS domain-containing protein [archaeon]|nr:CBS domain-containing protein [archaeon]
MKVKDLMTKNVISVKPDESLGDVVVKFMGNKISGAPVLDNEELVGVISKADILKQLSTAGSMHELLTAVSGLWENNKKNNNMDYLKKVSKRVVSDVMSRHVVTVDPESSIERAARLMTNRNINRLPVIENKKLLGILARGDLIKALANIE